MQEAGASYHDSVNRVISKSTVSEFWQRIEQIDAILARQQHNPLNLLSKSIDSSTWRTLRLALHRDAQQPTFDRAHGGLRAIRYAQLGDNMFNMDLNRTQAER